MAITRTVKLSEYTEGISASSHSTSSWTPSANKLYLFCLVFSGASSAPFITGSVTGNSLTWVRHDDVAIQYSTRRRMYIYRTMGSSPTTGAISWNTTANMQDAAWFVIEYDGVPTTGSSGSDAVGTMYTNTTGGATSLTVTNSDSFSAGDFAFGFVGMETSQAITVESGWDELSEITGASSNIRRTEIDDDAEQDTTITWSWTSSTSAGGMALKIIAAAGGGGATHPGWRGRTGWF